MRTEGTYSLLPSQVVVQPVLAAQNKGVGQEDQSDRQQGGIRFVGYGYDLVNKDPIYGPSGHESRTKTTCGELVDIYV